MPSSINLLTPSLGIQDVMEMTSAGQLPGARELAANALNEAGLEELYTQGNTRQLVELALCPDVGDGTMLSPQNFQNILDSIQADFGETEETSIRAMVESVLKPLQQNKALLQAYLGLMIGG